MPRLGRQHIFGELLRHLLVRDVLAHFLPGRCGPRSGKRGAGHAVVRGTRWCGCRGARSRGHG
eukprot:scaffold17408_cov36-Phaeocystis_antarctica.AAC.1